jgi:hypothetical protein
LNVPSRSGLPNGDFCGLILILQYTRLDSFERALVLAGRIFVISCQQRAQLVELRIAARLLGVLVVKTIHQTTRSYQ